MKRSLPTAGQGEFWLALVIPPPVADAANRQAPSAAHPGRPAAAPKAALIAASANGPAPAGGADPRRWRPPVERAIAWLVSGGNRRVPYRGITKNNTWLHHRAAALNLRRLVNLGLTRTSDGTWALA